MKRGVVVPTADAVFIRSYGTISICLSVALSEEGGISEGVLCGKDLTDDRPYIDHGYGRQIYK